MIKALFTKIACLQNIFKREYILLMDNTFNDDAELCDNFSLFEYLQNLPEYKNISFYVINRNSSQYKQIKEKYPHNIIPISNTTVNYALIRKLFKTKYWLDSFQVINKFNFKLLKYIKKSDIVTVYTQHGINFFKTSFVESSNEIGDYVFNKIVLSNTNERLLLKKYFGYDDRNTIIAGLARWDDMSANLNTTKKVIFIYFTFRAYLLINKNIKLESTQYVRNLINLCSDERLANILKEYNVELKIALHHVITGHIKDFNVPNIKLISDEEIGNAKQNASLLITDYSSMCFDFMFKNKPVIFYRLDHQSEILATCWGDRVNQICAEQKNDKIYNVFYDYNDVIAKIEQYCKNNFQLEEEYKIKNNEFFAYKDNIKKRIIDGIISSPANIPNDCDRVPFKTIEFGKNYDFREDLLDSISSEYIAQPVIDGRNSKGKYSRLWFKLPENIESEVTITVAPITMYKKHKHQFDIYLNDRFVETVPLADMSLKDIRIRIAKEDANRLTQKLVFKARSAKAGNKYLQIKFKNLIINKFSTK